MIRWTGLAPWEFEFPFPGSLTYTFLDSIVKNVKKKDSSAPAANVDGLSAVPRRARI